MKPLSVFRFIFLTAISQFWLGGMVDLFPYFYFGAIKGRMRLSDTLRYKISLCLHWWYFSAPDFGLQSGGGLLIVVSRRLFTSTTKSPVCVVLSVQEIRRHHFWNELLEVDDAIVIDIIKVKCFSDYPRLSINHYVESGFEEGQSTAAIKADYTGCISVGVGSMASVERVFGGRFRMLRILNRKDRVLGINHVHSWSVFNSVPVRSLESTVYGWVWLSRYCFA